MNETVPTLFAVALGGALGAMLRFRLRYVTQNAPISMGTLPANLIACLILGFVSALFADAFFAMKSWQGWFQPFLTVGVANSKCSNFYGNIARKSYRVFNTWFCERIIC